MTTRQRSARSRPARSSGRKEPREVAGALLSEQRVEPVQRDAAHRESQAAGRALERQDVDRQHRPVEEQHEEARRTRPADRRTCGRRSRRWRCIVPPSARQLRPHVDDPEDDRDHQRDDDDQEDCAGGGGRIVAAGRSRSSWPRRPRRSGRRSSRDHEEIAHDQGDDEDRAERDAGLRQREHDSPRSPARAWRRHRPPPRSATDRCAAMELKIGTIMKSVNRCT